MKTDPYSTLDYLLVASPLIVFFLVIALVATYEVVCEWMGRN